MKPPAADHGIVLVVDDDPKFARIAMRVLGRAGYVCFTEGSGEEALNAVTRHRPTVVVLDIMIPPPDGLSVCRRLRAQGWPGGIVMVSARNSPADRDAAVKAGADTFLGKPFPLPDLVSAVDSVVRLP